MKTGYMYIRSGKKYIATLKVRYELSTVYSVDIVNKETFPKSRLLTDSIRKPFEDYFSGKSQMIDVPTAELTAYTPFQKLVLDAIRKIPYGKTVTYKELAESVGKPKAYRAVANACGKNLLTLVIPCHRVVAANGLGGYSCGVNIKEYLLKLENINSY